MDDMNLLKLAMGLCLLAAAWLAYSIWRDKLNALKDEERAHFLMYNIAGGAWLFAVFALCGGFYFLLEPILT
jgi:small-conductance mechanosensitive channel